MLDRRVRSRHTETATALSEEKAVETKAGMKVLSESRGKRPSEKNKVVARKKYDIGK